MTNKKSKKLENIMKTENKIPVGILGATGSVGQKFIQLIANHPFFEIVEVMASDKSAGKLYKDAVNWYLPTPIPDKVSDLKVKKCEPTNKIRFVFSGLDSSVAGEIETNFANAGYTVVSNTKNHRFDKDVPLLIPEVNSEHLSLVSSQQFNGGMIVTNPNCSTIGLTMALKPLDDAFGIAEINVVTMQAISGAGFPGVSSLSIIDNIVPYINGEEEKIESEPLKILGKLENNSVKLKDFKISAQCNRVSVIDGHLESVQIKFNKKTTTDQIIKTWQNFKGEPQSLNLPTAPEKPIYYFENPDYPQPRLHRDLENGMAISVGRLKECSIFDYKFVVLSHNTMRGAAGGALLCAELLIKKGLFCTDG
jgi:aspartate-semialdehyde dehydrogenase